MTLSFSPQKSNSIALYVLRMAIIYVVIPLTFSVDASSQDSPSLPYYNMPSAPESYTAGNVIGRLIDGLGYRYYWATEGLRDEDFFFRPTPEARSMAETLDHLYGISLTILNAPQSIENIRPADWSDIPFEEKRLKTLQNLLEASEMIKAGAEGEMKDYRVLFQFKQNNAEFPFWNMINGPIADGLYHTGQIVSFRRTAGNPIYSGANVFTGKTKEK